MKIISHRGNLKGSFSPNENDPAHILDVLGLTLFDVEVDVWYSPILNKFMLGHDEPVYDIPSDFFTVDSVRTRLWWHAKSILTLHKLQTVYPHLHVFFHEEDPVALTSERYLWTHPKGLVDNTFTSRTVVVTETLAHLNIVFDRNFNRPYAICTDYPHLCDKLFNEEE